MAALSATSPQATSMPIAALGLVCDALALLPRHRGPLVDDLDAIADEFDDDALLERRRRRRAADLVASASLVAP